MDTVLSEVPPAKDNVAGRLTAFELDSLVALRTPTNKPLDTRIVRPGETTAQKGDPGNEMFIVLDGELEVDSPDGQKVVLGEGDFAGALTILSTNFRRTADIRAITPAGKGQNGDTTVMVLSLGDLVGMYNAGRVYQEIFKKIIETEVLRLRRMPKETLAAMNTQTFEAVIHTLGISPEQLRQNPSTLTVENMTDLHRIEDTPEHELNDESLLSPEAQSGAGDHIKPVATTFSGNLPGGK